MASATPSRASASALLALALAALGGCGGGAEDRPAALERLLDRDSFKALVAAAAAGEPELVAEPAITFAVRFRRGPEWLELRLGPAYSRYRATPGRREEIARSAVREAARALERGLADTPFAAVRDRLVPLLEPRFALRRLAREDPARRAFAGGLAVLYGALRDDSFLLASRADVERWDVGLARLARIAERNLARTTEELLCEEELCGWSNGDGFDATRMVVPELRRDIVREIGAAAYAVPTAGVFVAVPVEFAERIRPEVLEQFTTGEEPVSPEVFVERAGRLVPLEA